jgi:hypothetical protein
MQGPRHALLHAMEHGARMASATRGLVKRISEMSVGNRQTIAGGARVWHEENEAET